MPRSARRVPIGARRLSGTHAATSMPASIRPSASSCCHTVSPSASVRRATLTVRGEDSSTSGALSLRCLEVGAGEAREVVLTVVGEESLEWRGGAADELWQVRARDVLRLRVSGRDRRQIVGAPLRDAGFDQAGAEALRGPCLVLDGAADQVP